MSSPTFVSVPADRLLALVREIGEAVKTRGGSYTESVVGREIVADITPPERKASVRIFTSLAHGAGAARDCGKDAVRVCVVGPVKGKIKGLAKSRTLHRTAPRKLTESARVTTFLDRLKDASRTAYREALSHPTCPECGSVTALRKSAHGEFYGCTNYPECRGTRNVA